MRRRHRTRPGYRAFEPRQRVGAAVPEGGADLVVLDVPGDEVAGEIAVRLDPVPLEDAP